MTKCSLSGVVMPRYTVILNEGEQRVFVSLKPLPKSRRRIAFGYLARDYVAVEAINAAAVLAEMPRLQAEPLNVFDNRNQQITESRDKSFQFIVKRIFPKVVVQVSDQMDEAFLLRTR
jgi:hypothetical protein